MDAHTLHLSSALTNITCGVMLLIAWRLRGGATQFGWWGTAFFVFATGLLLQSSGMDRRLSGGLVYGLLVSGTLLLLAGLRVFDGLPPFSRLMAWSLPIPSISWFGLQRWLSDTPWPEPAVFLVAVAVCAQAPYHALRFNPEGLLFRRVVGSTLLFQSLATVLVVLGAPNVLAPEKIGIAISLTDQVCSTIVIACVLGMCMERDNRRLDRMAHADVLTGCANRAGLEAYLETDRTPCSVLVVDLDHFKMLNDRYGHAAGDEVLREFSRRAARCLPSDAILSRTGGEEFVAIIPGRCRRAADEAATRLIADVAAGPLLWRDHRIDFTVSIGLAFVPRGMHLEDGMQSADAALYRSKACGRNRHTWAEHAAPTASEGPSTPNMRSALG